MKVWQIGILLLLAGCGAMGLGDKRTVGTQAPALDVPPDLSTRDNRYKEPEGESVATYSDYNKGGAVASQKVIAVLPEIKGVSLMRNGEQRWLVVNDKPENVWSVVKAFLQENGLSINNEDSAARILETDWVESRTAIPQDGIRNLIGKAFDNGYSSSQLDQYRVYLKSGKDRTGAEVYINHRGMEEILSSDGNTSKWQARAPDPEMEAIMLQRLMARFGDRETPVAALVPATVAATVPPAESFSAASLQVISDDSRIIVLNDAFDRSWRRVGLAIERAGLVVEDKDRTRGIYFLQPVKANKGFLDKLQFWKDSTDSRYRVNVKDGGMLCEVSVTDQNGESDNASNLMIDALYKGINQGATAAVPASNTAPAEKAQVSTPASPPVPAGTASLQEISDGSSVIVVNDSFDKTWHRIGLAIERAGLAVESMDRTRGNYFLRHDKGESSWQDKLMFWKNSENSYHVSIKDSGNACMVLIKNQADAQDDTARQLIATIYKNIGQ